MKKPAQKRPGIRLINTLINSELLQLLDAAVRREDTDRSKFVRAAIREKIHRGARHHFPAPAREIPPDAAASGATTQEAEASNPTHPYGAAAPAAPVLSPNPQAK